MVPGIEGGGYIAPPHAILGIWDPMLFRVKSCYLKLGYLILFWVLQNTFLPKNGPNKLLNSNGHTLEKAIQTNWETFLKCHGSFTYPDPPFI